MAMTARTAGRCRATTTPHVSAQRSITWLQRSLLDLCLLESCYMRVLPWLLVMLVGCGASLTERADDAFKRRDFGKAAELYDQALARRPTDPKLLARRTEARHARLGMIFHANQVARRNGDRTLAIRHLGNLLAQRDTWAMAIDPRSANALAAEVGMAGNDIAIEVDHRTNTVGPLAGEMLLGEHAPLLRHADFGGRGSALQAKVEAVGRGACDQLAVDATTPFWKWTIDRYCAHWGERGKVGTVLLEDLRSELHVVGSAAGERAGETDLTRAALAKAFRASAWYSPTGFSAVHAQLSGRVAIDVAQQQVQQHTFYDEEVSYTEDETSQESYQEPYDDPESYSEQVPYTETETHSERCANSCVGVERDCSPSMCTKTETVTKYRTESKTRTVTKYRTAWRSVTNPVTKYRTVTHPYDYSTIEVTGSYATLHVLRVLEGEGEGARVELVGVTAQVEHAKVLSGVDHDVTFAAAGVYPSRAELPTREDVLAAQRQELQRRLVAVLDERYARLYCTASTYDVEAAARCAYLDHPRAPAAVHARLRAVFGADEPFLGSILSRR